MDMMLLVRGKVELTRDEKGRQLIVERVFPIEEAKTRLAKYIHVQTTTGGLTEKLLRELDEPLDPTPLSLVWTGPRHRIPLKPAPAYIHDLHARKHKVQCESELIDKLIQHFGSEQVRLPAS